MEWALQPASPVEFSKPSFFVSILVLMEWALQLCGFGNRSGKSGIVSILVLMEWALQREAVVIMSHGAGCFNPCLNGMGTSTLLSFHLQYWNCMFQSLS